MIKHFVILGEPKGKQRPKFTTINGHARAITPKQTIAYENLVVLEYRTQAGGHYFPDNKPVFALIDCFMQIPKKPKQTTREMLSHLLRPMKKVDWDNAGKIICDSLNGIAYHDDSQIVDGRVRKYWSQRPRVEVTLSDQPINMENYIVKEETLQ